MSWALARSRAAGDVTLHDAGVDLDRERGQAVTDSFLCRAPAAVLKVLEALSHGGSDDTDVEAALPWFPCAPGPLEPCAQLWTTLLDA